MARIFISYRRYDSAEISARIYDTLVAAFGRRNIFKDVDNIPVGTDFRAVIERELISCDTMLVVIGPQWLNIADANGNRRLDNPEDFVRIEVELGLRHKNIRVIPVLVEGALMPAERDLPPRLQTLAFQNAATLRNERFDYDLQRLIRAIRPSRYSPRVIMAAAILILIGIITAVLAASGVFRPPIDPIAQALTQTAIIRDATIIADFVIRTNEAQTLSAAWTDTPTRSSTSTDSPTPTSTLSSTLTSTDDFIATSNAQATANAEATFNVTSNTIESSATDTAIHTNIPSVEFLAPVNDSSVVEGTNLPIELVATDLGPGVVRVDLLVDDMLHQEATPLETTAVPTFTITLNWLAEGVGFHSLTAISYREDGTASPSTTIIIQVVPREQNTLRVGTYNINGGYDEYQASNLEGIARAIQGSGANVVMLQELNADHAQWLAQRVGMEERFFSIGSLGEGLGVLSNVEIVSDEGILLTTGALQQVQIRPDEGVITLYNIWLGQSLQQTDGQQTSDYEQLLDEIFGKIADDHPDGNLGRIILGGTFNISPASSLIERLYSAGFQDPFAGSIESQSFTFQQEAFQDRFDYLWTRQPLLPMGVLVMDSQASDHRMAVIEVLISGST